MLDDLLARDGVVILDGGVGTTLEDRGVDVRNPLWSSIALLSPEGRARVEGVHADFAAAGAEMVIANSHNASAGSCAAFLRERGLEPFEPELRDHLAEAEAPGERVLRLVRALNGTAVELARRAVPAGVVVAAGIGSAEGAYATQSRFTPERLEARLAPHAEALVAAGAELLIFETVSTASELQAIARIAPSLRVPFAVGLTVAAADRTHAGVRMADAVRALEAAPPRVWFVQCTRYDRVAPALDALREAAGEAVLGAYGNDGREWRDRRWIGERIDVEAYAAAAEPWRDQGAKIIGGCCGTGPEHIAALAKRRYDEPEVPSRLGRKHSGSPC